tara:strand:+ start:3323 stop:4090 length:768 start_codon:yes stop_codon:yes gene_type:complete
MKRIIGLGVVLVFVCAFIAIASVGDACQVVDDCYTDEQKANRKVNNDRQCLDKVCQVKSTSGGGFVLKGNNSFFGLTSKNEGFGFGLDMPKTLFFDRTIYLHQLNLRQVTFLANKNNLSYQYGADFTHFKQLFTPKDYSGYNEYDTFEIVTTYEDNLAGFELVVRIENETLVEPKDVLMLLDNEKGVKEYSGELLENDLDGYYFKFTIPSAGLVSIVSRDGAPIQLPKVEEKESLNETVVELDEFFVNQTETLDA